MNAPKKNRPRPRYHLGGPRAPFMCSSYCKHTPPTVNTIIVFLNCIIYAGVYIKFIVLPPTFLIYIFPKMKFITLRGCAPQVKIFKPFCRNFANFMSIGGKKYAYFYQLGKKYAFSPFFDPLINNFFSSQHVYNPYLGFKQKNIHPCVYVKRVDIIYSF